MASTDSPPESEGSVSKLFVDKLIYGITHDLGASARQMHQFSQLIAKQQALRELPQIAVWLDYLAISSKDFQEKILALSNLRGISKSKNNRIYTNLKDLINSHINDFSALSNDANIDFINHDIFATVNVEHWNYLVTALLQNALTFRKIEEPKIETKIKIRLTLDGSILIFTIEDNGIGVRQNNHEDLCRPFKRLCANNEYPGLGVGLTICWYIAELNNGHIGFENSDMGGLKVVYQQPTSIE
ncbi:ATP-binding protein [Sessilibacter sp. MAH4]